MKIIDEQTTPPKFVETSELTPSQLKALAHPLAHKILTTLSVQSIPTLKLAKQLRVHEQTLYYIIHKLVAAKLLVAQLDSTGKKTYVPSSASYFIRLSEMKQGNNIKTAETSFLNPFIENKTFNANIIVGSPDPHGPHLARSKDGYFGMDLAVFLGSFITTFPKSVVKLDTEAKPIDLSENLILIGGPIVNQISAKLVNGPVSFDAAKRAFIIKKNKKVFIDEDIGIVCKQKSPFAKDKYILYVAGIRNYGTRAAIQGLIKHFSEFESFAKNNDEFCAVLRGEDIDSDGIVDNASIIGFY